MPKIIVEIQRSAKADSQPNTTWTKRRLPFSGNRMGSTSKPVDCLS